MFARRHLAAASVAATALAMIGIAAPGAADTSAVTVTVTAGALVLDAPATASGSGGTNSTVNVSVDDIIVDDDRGTLAGWTAIATMGDLITDDGLDTGETILASTMTWTTTAVTPNEGQVGIALPAAGAADVGAVMAIGLPVVSPGEFDIDGTLTVPIPVNAISGAFSGTLTTTVS